MQLQKFEKLAFTVLILLSVVGGVMRFINLDFKEFWYDESYTALVLSGHTEAQFFENVVDRAVPFSDLRKFRTVGSDSTVPNISRALFESEPGHAPLFYLLNWLFCKAFGSTPFTFRFISALISAFTLPVIFFLASETYSNRLLAALTTAFAALSPSLIYFAQEARDYSLGLFFMFLSNALLLYSLRTGKHSGWLGYGISLVLGLYSWLLTVCAALGQVFFVLLGKERRKKYWRQFLGTFLLAGVLFGPWLYLIKVNSSTLFRTYSWLEPSVPYDALVNVWLTIFCKAFALFGWQTSHYEWLLIGITFFEFLSFAVAARFLRGPKYLQLCIIVVWFVIFAGQDLLLGGARSAPFRYQTMVIGCTLILFASLAEWLFTLKIAALNAVAVVVVSLFIGIESFSSVTFLQEKNWPNKAIKMRLTYPIGHYFTSLHAPLLVCERSRINLVELLDLSQVAPPDSGFLYMKDVNDSPFPASADEFYLWNASTALEKRCKLEGYSVIQGVEGVPCLKRVSVGIAAPSATK
ncbi:MAG TPA: glycosyltransferase family 39 protein [Oculatellaceae cyanobacterium]